MIAIFQPRQFLAFMVSCLSAGYSIAADMAGRVNFVSGKVQAIEADGSERTLNKGDLVYRGERLDTGNGRLQIRFTDGSIVSLQPDTSFKVDDYQFDKSKPEQGRVQFNFLRGGFRTVTGAIGKVNRANYTVRSPVATIGIRGTGYATTLHNGLLTLTVDKGIVNLSNPFGSSNVNAGQTFQVEAGQAPKFAPAGVNAAALAQSPTLNTEGDNETDTPSQIHIPLALLEGEINPLTLPNNNIILTDSFYAPQSGTPEPNYSFASRFLQSDNKLLITNVGGFFERQNSSELGSLNQLTVTRNNTINTLFNRGNSQLGGLHTNNVQSFSGLSIGEWHNGTASIGTLDTSDNTISLANNEFEPYAIGRAASAVLGMDSQGQGITLNYSLMGATPARSTAGDTGTVSQFNLALTLSAVALVDVDMTVRMQQTGTYRINQQNIAINNQGSNLLTGFQLENTELIAEGQACISSGCPVTLAVFLAEQLKALGVIYNINLNNGQQIGGALAGGLTNASSENVLLPNTNTGDYKALFVSATRGQQQEQMSVSFASNGAWQQGVDSDNKLYQAASTNPANNTEITHINRQLSWGKWAEGELIYEDSTLNLDADSVHYLVGIPTTANFPTTQLSYNLVGGTTPSVIIANAGSNSTASLSYGAIDIDFGRQTTGLSFGLNVQENNQVAQVDVSGNGSLNAGNLSFNDLFIGTTVNNNQTFCGNCQGSAQGFVMGTNADGVALSYQLTGVPLVQQSADSIHGVMLFANPHPTPVQP
ncbi:FecR family protein [Agitococcus lubricus]|uniref:FecR family protein n=1 Tax=Agitococcus lubricus TaxID=1077255 RepID=A0A2T5IUG3_9GAMM|nr:FecR family protein [Agitococcus lubricus]PTQ87508.1 FecR family protein [Agitococcus lubricus]